MTNETYSLPAGTKVRTIYGAEATLLVEWFVWECSVTVTTASGHTERYHPTKVFRSGESLPYQP